MFAYQVRGYKEPGKAEVFYVSKVDEKTKIPVEHLPENRANGVNDVRCAWAIRLAWMEYDLAEMDVRKYPKIAGELKSKIKFIENAIRGAWV